MLLLVSVALAQTPPAIGYETGTSNKPPNGRVTFAVLKYAGGGDWYNDPEQLPNLAYVLNQRTNIGCNEERAIVDLDDDKIFNYPFVFITGHGNIVFTDAEVKRLRAYLENGGFLYADDDFGMDQYFRREIARVFPDNALVELPFSHPIYHMVYDFPNGLPKIHEHYPGPPKGFGIYYQDRLVVYYTWNTNIADGWEFSAEVHNDPSAKRDSAFDMGVNIATYALTH
jgi:hypothetical protein